MGITSSSAKFNWIKCALKSTRKNRKFLMLSSILPDWFDQLNTCFECTRLRFYTPNRLHVFHQLWSSNEEKKTVIIDSIGPNAIAVCTVCTLNVTDTFININFICYQKKKKNVDIIIQLHEMRKIDSIFSPFWLKF